jgi:hypothetical protein
MIKNEFKNQTISMVCFGFLELFCHNTDTQPKVFQAG